MVESSQSASSRIHLESNTLNGTDGDTGNNGITNSSADLNGDASVENGSKAC